jgi:hypothetical protein
VRPLATLVVESIDALCSGLVRLVTMKATRGQSLPRCAYNLSNFMRKFAMLLLHALEQVGTDTSNPAYSSGESGTNSVQGVPHNRSVMFSNGSTAIDGLSGSPLCLPSGRAPMIYLPATATPGELSPTVTILLFLRLPAISTESLSRLLRRRVV